MSAITDVVASAPRTEEELAQKGVFFHRRVAEQLFDLGFKLWDTEQKKTAFITAAPTDRAKALAYALQQYDAGGGAVTPPQPAAPAPVVEEAPAPAKRAPKTSNGNAQAAAPVGNEAFAAMKSISEQIAVVSNNIGALMTQNQASQSQSMADVQKELFALKQMLASILPVQNALLGLLSLFGQQVLGCPMEDFMPSAIEDAKKAVKILDGGKA